MVVVPPATPRGLPPRGRGWSAKAPIHPSTHRLTNPRGNVKNTYLQHQRLGIRDALEGKGPQRKPQKRLVERLEEVAKSEGGGGFGAGTHNLKKRQATPAPPP